MAWRTQLLFWLAAAAVFIAFLVVFDNILLPFVAGLFIAYLLNPVARRLQRVGLSRPAAALVIVAGFLLTLVVVLVLLVPVMINQAINLLGALPGLATQAQTFVDDHLATGRVADVLNIDAARIQTAVGDFVGRGADWLLGFLESLLASGQAFVQSVALLVLTPVVVFYVLLDWDRMVAAVDRNLPRDHRATIHRLLAEMDRNVSGFVHGQLLVGLLLGLLYAVTLLAVGLNHAVLIGLGSGLISFIPYLGTIVGFVASVGVALDQFWPDYVMIGIVAGIFVIGQQIEGYVLQPRLVGNKVGLHPVWLIFALIAFGSLLGFAGMLVAVPAASAVGVLFRFALKQYRASPFYAGSGGAAAGRQTVARDSDAAASEAPAAQAPGERDRA